MLLQYILFSEIANGKIEVLLGCKYRKPALGKRYPDGRGVGFYFRNVTEILLFGVKGESYRTLPPARSQVNLVRSVKREHSRKPDEIYPIIEACSAGPFLEMFARGVRENWVSWGNQADSSYEPTWHTYANHTHSGSSEQDDNFPESDLFAFG